MESNEKNELTSTTDRLTDGEQDASYERWYGGGGIKRKIKVLVDVNNSVLIAGTVLRAINCDRKIQLRKMGHF